MAKRAKKTLTEIDMEKPIERATPESERRFPSHLSPIIQCKKSVLDRSRIEFYAAIVIGAAEVVLPVSALTRTLILLFALGPLIDIAWRSPWTHSRKTLAKVWITIVLVLGYFAIVAWLFAHEHKEATRAFEGYMRSGKGEWLIRWLYALVASAVTYAGLKGWRLLHNYIETSRAEERAIKKKFYDSTPKGWLDYRMESQDSSAHLHFLVSRLGNRLRVVARFMRMFPWFVNEEDKKQPEKRARLALFFIVLACEAYTRRIEPEVRDMEATTELFMKSTEGHLKTLSIITKDDFVQLASLHEYFKCQLSDIRDMTNALAPLPSALGRLRGHSQESTAAINRLLVVINSQTRILRRVEGHCARMVKMAETNLDRALLKVTKPLLTSLEEIIRIIKGDEGIREYRRLLKEQGINPSSIGLKERA